MARGKYYIIRDGERLYKDTIKAIATAAQKFANEINGPVTVFEDTSGLGWGGRRRGVVKPYKRNPTKRPTYSVTKTANGYVGTVTLPTRKTPLKSVPMRGEASAISWAKDTVAAYKRGYIR